MVQLRSWMIPAEACPETFVTLKGACGKTTTTLNSPDSAIGQNYERIEQVQMDVIQTLVLISDYNQQLVLLCK